MSELLHIIPITTITQKIRQPRKCSICKSPNHTKTKCPTKPKDDNLNQLVSKQSSINNDKTNNIHLDINLIQDTTNTVLLSQCLATNKDEQEQTNSTCSLLAATETVNNEETNSITTALHDLNLVATRTTNNTLSDYFEIISANKYINKYEADGVDIHSFSYLSNRKLTKSQNIKLGISMENFWADVLSKNTIGWKSIKEKNKVGFKEKDHLYLNDTLKEIIYCEQKNNINLDTEKSKATKDKLQLVKAEILSKYPDYKLSNYLFAARYLDTDTEQIAQSIIKTKKYENVIGVNNLLQLFGNPCPKVESYSQYTVIIDKICATKFRMS
jgi:hypothetical protein